MMNENKEIIIVDSCYGTGKTSWAIQKMNECKQNRFIYITPYTDELNRVIDACDERIFYKPNITTKKGHCRDAFKNLIIRKKNIATTYLVFQEIDKETMDLIEEYGYILILDEVENTTKPIPTTKDDKNDLARYTEVDENNKIHWTCETYTGVFDRYFNAMNNGEVYTHRGAFFAWTFPSFIFDKFKEVYIMTYMFNSQIQRYYYDLNNIKYIYKSVGMINDRYELIEYQDIDKTIYRELLKICDNEKLNNIGKSKGQSKPLSASWFNKNIKSDNLNVLKKHLINYFTTICNVKSSECGWTVYKDYQKHCKGKGYTKGFMPLSAGSINQYRNKTTLAYCVNLYMNPIVKSFFTDRGIEISEDEWALSALIQFIFRGCVRDKKEMNIYIPSERMRKLLIEWLEN